MSLWSVETTPEGIVVASYTNPPRNYFTTAGTAELASLIRGWRDPAPRVVVLTGGPPDLFITHYSVEELLALARAPEAARRQGPAANRGYHDLLRNLRSLPFPIIAAMNGDTMGGGFELSLSCDIRIARSGDHRFGLPEATLGILPGGSGTQRLARLIGAGRAIEFILRGRICTASEAHDLGLVHEVAEDPRSRALEIATELCSKPAVALAQIKRAVYQGSDVGLDAGLEIESAAFVETLTSPQARGLMEEYVALPVEDRRAWLDALSDQASKGR